MQPDGGGAAGGEGAASEGTDPDVETAINEAAAALERARAEEWCGGCGDRGCGGCHDGECHVCLAPLFYMAEATFEGRTCSFCMKTACEPCLSTCARCEGTFCTFCSTCK